MQKVHNLQEELFVHLAIWLLTDITSTLVIFSMKIYLPSLIINFCDINKAGWSHWLILFKLTNEVSLSYILIYVQMYISHDASVRVKVN